MLKVLVADRNPVSNLDCCRYLAKDKNLNVVSSSSGFSTINKYNEISPDILMINSDFKDISYTEIINKLSSTSQERNKCNIFLTLKKRNKILEFDYMAKIYKLYYYPLNYNNLKKGIEQYNIDKIIFYEPNENNLSALFYKLHLYNDRAGATYFKYAIIQCYHNPKLLNCLKTIFSLIAQDFNVPYSSIRPAMRTALKPVNKYRDSQKNNHIFKLFENEDSITPMQFITIITNHYLNQKNKK